MVFFFPSVWKFIGAVICSYYLSVSENRCVREVSSVDFDFTLLAQKILSVVVDDERDYKLKKNVVPDRCLTYASQYFIKKAMFCNFDD